MIYEYLCDSCGEVTTAVRRVADRKEVQVCDGCGADANFIVSVPHFSLDPSDPAFAGTYDKWGRDRAAHVAKINKTKAEHGSL